MTLAKAIAAAPEGAVIDWSGQAPVTGLKNMSKAVTIRGARFAGMCRILGCANLTIEDYSVDDPEKLANAGYLLSVDASASITLRRGKLAGGGMNGRGLLITRSKGVLSEGLKVGGVYRGVLVDRSQDVTLRDTEVHHIRSDGLNIGVSQKVTIDGLTARDMLSEGHPDVIQIINSPTTPGICSDILIRGVRAKVQAQGINLFDHGRGGADRVLIEDVDLLVGYYHAINMENVRGLILRNIRVGAHSEAGPKIKPWVKTTGSTDVVTENVVTGWDGSDPAKPSPFSDEQEARIRAIVREARQ